MPLATDKLQTILKPKPRDQKSRGFGQSFCWSLDRASGPDEIRTRDLGLDRAACLAATPRVQWAPREYTIPTPQRQCLVSYFAGDSDRRGCARFSRLPLDDSQRLTPAPKAGTVVYFPAHTYSYPERRRDRPDEASATCSRTEQGANSGRGCFWKMRGSGCAQDLSYFERLFVLE
jgi:hypothetical protein